jgi:hypothetical protein
MGARIRAVDPAVAAGGQVPEAEPYRGGAMAQRLSREIRVVDIMTAMATASQAIKLANDLRGIDKAVNEAEFKLKIADLTVALSDIKMALWEAKEDLGAKQSEIDKLKKTFHRFSDTMEFAGISMIKGQTALQKECRIAPYASKRAVF